MATTIPTPANETPSAPPPSVNLSPLALAALEAGIAVEDVRAYVYSLALPLRWL